MSSDDRFLPGSAVIKPGTTPVRNRAGARHAQYLKAQVETASPTQLILMLYDGANRFCSMAIDAMEQKDYQGQNTALQRAQQILSHLITSLNLEKGGDIALNLQQLYFYLYEQLVYANLNDKPEVVREVQAHLVKLREGWAEVDKSARMGTLSNDEMKSKLSPGGSDAK